MTMRAMVLQKIGEPLQLQKLPIPTPQRHEVLVKVQACGVCRTDLHIVDGELSSPKLPLILGHQIVGRVAAIGEEVRSIKIGDRMGAPWLWGCCGSCEYCLSGFENLCDDAIFNGYQVDGGFAEYALTNEHFSFPLPSNYSDIQAAPLLCAGLIGYRALKMAGEAKKIGFYGFGASAHLLVQAASSQGREVFAFTRSNDRAAQEFALQLGAKWAGSSEESSPQLLDAAIIFAPRGALIPKSLQSVRKGGTVICAGIHMSDIPSFPYSLLWGERVIRSVANLTRQDGIEFLELASKIPLNTQVKAYPLEKANEALNDLRAGKFTGAAVLTMSEEDRGKT